MSRTKLLSLGLVTVAAVSLAAASFLIARTNQPQPLTEPRITPPVQPPASAEGGLIGAVGLVEPSSQAIRMGTEVSGTVVEVFVAAGDAVKQGDPLFALDRSLAEANLHQREQDFAVAMARLAHVRARLAGFESQVEASRNAVNAAEADLDEARDVLRIADELKGSGSIADRDITRRRNLVRNAESKVAEARSRLRQSEADLALHDESQGGAAIGVEAAAAEQARSVVAMARTDLALRTVRAPGDATVLQVNLRPGEYAQAGMLATPLMVLGRTAPLHVRVELDEADISRFTAGMPAVASARGDGARRHPLRFVRVEPLVVPKRALAGDVAERVDTRVMQVLYAVEGSSHDLLVGQQLDVFIAPQPGAVSALTSNRSAF